MQGLRVPIDDGWVFWVRDGSLVATPCKTFQELGEAGLKVLV
jgi:hypothetical protein